MPSADTIHLGVCRALSGEQRLQVAADMSEAARVLFLARLRVLHPTWQQPRLVDEWIRQVHGLVLDRRLTTSR